MLLSFQGVVGAGMELTGQAVGAMAGAVQGLNGGGHPLSAVLTHHRQACCAELSLWPHHATPRYGTREFAMLPDGEREVFVEALPCAADHGKQTIQAVEGKAVAMGAERDSCYVALLHPPA